MDLLGKLLLKFGVYLHAMLSNSTLPKMSNKLSNITIKEAEEIFKQTGRAQTLQLKDKEGKTEAEIKIEARKEDES